MDPTLLQSLGEELYLAAKTRKVSVRLTERYPDIAVADAYRIQQDILAHHRADGRRITGKKIGLTSKAMQTMFGVFEPDFGSLLDHLAFDSGDEVPGEPSDPAEGGGRDRLHARRPTCPTGASPIARRSSTPRPM